jgi:hypothetical protein
MDDFSGIDFALIRCKAEEKAKAREADVQEKYRQKQLELQRLFRKKLHGIIESQCQHENYESILLHFPPELDRKSIHLIMDQLRERDAILTYTYYKDDGMVTGNREATYTGDIRDKERISTDSKVYLHLD